MFQLAQSRALYFFGDDWSFLLNRHLTWAGLMEPHNEHWSTLPVLAFIAMRHVFGIDHYPAYASMPIVLHAGCSTLLYLLMRRHHVPAWPAIALVLPFAFLVGDIGENPLWDFQIGFLGSALLGLCALHAHSALGRTRLPAYPTGWVCSILALMCSGMGIMLLTWLGAYLLLRRGLVRALIATVPPGVVYLVWYGAYGRDATAQAPSATADQVVAFAATGLGSLWQQVVRVDATGGAVLLVLAAFAVAAPLLPRQRDLALSGILVVIATYLLLGTSRAGLGSSAATASRYSYFGLMFTIPAAALCLAWIGKSLPERRLERALTLGVVCALLIGNGIAQTLAFVDGRATLNAGLQDRIAATQVLVAGGGRFLSTGVSLPYAPDITPKALARPSVREELPNRHVGQRKVLNTSVLLQTASSPTSLGLPAPTGLGSHNLTGTVSATGCSTVTAETGAWIDLPPTRSGTQVQLTSATGTYPSQLLSGNHVSDAVVLTAVPGAATYIATTSRRGTLRVNLAAGTLLLCQGTAAIS